MTATIETTLTTKSHQIRQLAFDGDDRTYFSSVQNPGKADHLTFVLDEPVIVKWITVATGRPDGSDKLEAGMVEASTDGKAFHNRANFTDGAAFAVPGDRPIRAIRIKPATDSQSSAGDPRAEDRVRSAGGRLQVSGRVYRGRDRCSRDQGLGRQGGAGLHAVVPDDQRGAQERGLQAADKSSP